MTTKLKDVMIAKNVLARLGKEAVSELEDEMYGMDGGVLCVDCTHLESDSECRYTWFIPLDREYNIEDGDILVVEQVVGVGLALVKAQCSPYFKTIDMHEMEIHPYCRVIRNIGKQKLNY